MSDSETIYSESERSEDSDSEGSLADFIDDEEEPEVCLSCHTEICVSNIINRKRRRTSAVSDESDDEDEASEESDSSSDYVPSEVDDSCSEGSESSGEDE